MEEHVAFGELLRELRTGRGERQLDLAEALGTDVTFISAIEAGRKKAPDRFVEQVIRHYDQDDEGAERLRRLASVAHTHLKVPLEGASNRHREVLGMYARRFSALTDEQLAQVERILESKSK